MDCPKCGGKTKVDGTEHWRGLTVRYRTCRVCGHKFKSVESVKEAQKPSVTPYMESATQ